jgi:two-component system, OmpR family, phosphate regulon response regulator OmpR
MHRPMWTSRDHGPGRRSRRCLQHRGELYRGGDLVHLTAAEAGLLSMLAQKAGQAVSREELSMSLSGNVRNVDVQMTRLRRKIERDPRFPRYLQTVRGTGYILKPD